MDLGASPWIWAGSRNFTGIITELYGIVVDLPGSTLALGTSFFDLNVMDLGKISIDLGISLECNQYFVDLKWISMDLHGHPRINMAIH